MNKIIPKAIALLIAVFDLFMISMWDSKYYIYPGRWLKLPGIIVLSLALIFFSDYFELFSQKDHTPAAIFKVMGWICLLGMTPWIITRFIDNL